MTLFNLVILCFLVLAIWLMFDKEIAKKTALGLGIAYIVWSIILVPLGLQTVMVLGVLIGGVIATIIYLRHITPAEERELAAVITKHGASLAAGALVAALWFVTIEWLFGAFTFAMTGGFLGTAGGVPPPANFPMTILVIVQILTTLGVLVWAYDSPKRRVGIVAASAVVFVIGVATVRHLIPTVRTASPTFDAAARNAAAQAARIQAELHVATNDAEAAARLRENSRIFVVMVDQTVLLESSGDPVIAGTGADAHDQVLVKGTRVYLLPPVTASGIMFPAVAVAILDQYGNPSRAAVDRGWVNEAHLTPEEEVRQAQVPPTPTAVAPLPPASLAPAGGPSLRPGEIEIARLSAGMEQCFDADVAAYGAKPWRALSGWALVYMNPRNPGELCFKATVNNTVIAMTMS